MPESEIPDRSRNSLVRELSEGRTLLIVTATLNGGAHWEAMLASVYSLPVPFIHVVVCPQKQLEHIREIAPQSHVIPEPVNCDGMYAAINRGICFARHLKWTHFTYINDDDLLISSENYYWGKCLSSKGIIYGKICVVNEAGRRLFIAPVSRFPGINHFLWGAGKTPCVQQGMVFSRACIDALDGFSHHLKLAADMDFIWRAEQLQLPIKYSGRIVAAFRIREGQLSANQDAFRKEIFSILEREPSQLQWVLGSLIMFLMNPAHYLRFLCKFGLKRKNDIYK
jgi:hypothetical protein